MENGSGNLAWLVLGAAGAQLLYYTLLIGVVGARLSSRIALMEFKVNELWNVSRASKEEE